MHITSKIKDKIKVRASFITGSNPKLRDSKDSRMNSAIQDVELFLSKLPEYIDEPTIYSGTTSNPENIITLSWLVGGYSTIKAASVSFQGHGKCNIYYDSPDGKKTRKTDISISDAIISDISENVKKLISHAYNSNKGPYFY